MTIDEFNKAIESGQTQILQQPTAPDTSQPDTTPNLDEYIIVLNALREIKRPLGAAPTFTPKNFLEQFQFVDDGTNPKVPYIYINGTWIKLPASIIQSEDGGTGESTYDDGELLIGDTSDHKLKKATLSTDSDLQVTNGHGSIQVNFIGKRLKQTVSFIGPTPSVGDLLTYIPTQSGQTIYRIEGDPGTFEGADVGTTGSQKRGFRFKAPFSFTLKTLKTSLKKVGTPSDNTTIGIFSDSGGNPNSQLGLVSEAAAGLTTSFVQFTETFNVDLVGGTNYWIVHGRSGAFDDTNYFQTYQNVTGLTMSDFHPDSASKSNNGAAWSTIRTGSRYELLGDVTAGWQKYWGARTNIDVFPQMGVVESVSDSQATIVLEGYISGLSGLTRGAFLTINGVRAGTCLSTTEAHIFSRKSITLKNLSLGNTSGYQINLPLGFTHLTEVTTNSPTIATGTGKERLYTLTAASSVIAVTNEYESIS